MGTISNKIRRSLLGDLHLTRKFAQLSLCASVAAFALSPAAIAAEQKIIKVVPSADLSVLDPHYAPITITRIYSLMVYETLFALDADMQPQPLMVESWEITPDQLAWNFKLRDELKFHDNTPVTSEDVRASLSRWMERDTLGKVVGGYVDEITVKNDHEFTIALNKPAPFLSSALASAAGQIPAIIKASDIVEGKGTPIATAIGSGPYKFNHAEWRPGSVVRFDKNTDYVPRSEEPNGLSGARNVDVDGIEWRVMPDTGTALSALMSGEVDMIESPPLELLSLLDGNPDIKVEKINELNFQAFLRPNSLHAPFNNEYGRQALAYLANQTDYLSAAFGVDGRWNECAAYFICNSPYGAVSNAKELPHKDIEKAKSLLEKAGYKGERITFVATKEIPTIGLMSEVVAAGLREAGVDVDLQWMDWGAMSQKITSKEPVDKGGWNLFVTYGSGITMHSPVTSTGTNMACDQQNWSGWPCDEKVQELRQQFLLAADTTERDAVLSELQERLELLRPYVPLGEFDAPVAIRSDVTGLLQSPVVTYWNLAK